MIPHDTIQTSILTAQLKLATLTNTNLTKLQGGALKVNWSPINKGQMAVNCVSRQFNLGDYGSLEFLNAYDCLLSFIGGFGAGAINPNAQNPGQVIDVTTVVQAQGNFTRIPFNGVTNVSLSNFQSVYAPLYGDDAIVTIWVTFDNFATVQQDTGTVPTIVNAGGDINKPDSYTWVYPITTSGYVQINGFTAQGGNTSAGLPITNSGSSFLSNAQLNTLYPTALWGQIILVPAINVQYIKLDNSPTGLWSYEPYNPNT